MKHVNHEDFFEYIENYAKEKKEKEFEEHYQHVKETYDKFLTENPIYVIVNGDRVNEREVEFLNIEEDYQGRDILTFNYQGKKYTSYRIS